MFWVRSLSQRYGVSRLSSGGGSFHFICCLLRLRSRCDSRRGLSRHLRRHLRHLVVTATRCPMLVGWVMVHLVGTGLEMGLLLRVIAADWGHYAS